MQEQIGKHVLLDTNLLLVVIIGYIDQSLICRHKRTSSYTSRDFQRLIEILRDTVLVTTPHILTEVSNLGSHGLHGETKEFFFNTLKHFVVKIFEELSVSSTIVVESPVFTVLGLTDAAIEQIAQKGIVILTADAPLAAQLNGRNLKVINYNHLRLQSF